MELGFGIVALNLRESYLSFLIIGTWAKNTASSVSKVAPASGWDVCSAIPLFLTSACGVLHTESVLETWRMWLDVAILPYSAASQGPFDLGCPKVTETLFKVHLLPSVMTHLPFGSWWVWCPVVCLLCNSLCSSKVSTSRCVLCSVCKSTTNLAGCWTEKIQARHFASYFSNAEVVIGQANSHLCLGKAPAML